MDETIQYDGRLLSYFLIAHTDFIKEQKNLHDFRVVISEEDEFICVAFSPKLAPGERILGGRTSLGRGVSYYVSKKDSTVCRRLFHR